MFVIYKEYYCDGDATHILEHDDEAEAIQTLNALSCNGINGYIRAVCDELRIMDDGTSTSLASFVIGEIGHEGNFCEGYLALIPTTVLRKAVQFSKAQEKHREALQVREQWDRIKADLADMERLAATRVES